MAAAIWWLVFWTAAGLCVGSFLNVVLYRLPRDQSILDPRWSHCPHCGHRIRWYDNLPILSYVLLGGRCRDCRVPISVRYPIVEALTAAIVLVVFDAFFVSRTRTGLSNESFLMWSLLEDWPIYLAHVVLMSCLLAMAAIDLQHYWVDIRFTTLAAWAGVILHAFWTPTHSSDWFRPSPAVAAGSCGALIGLVPLWVWLRRRAQGEIEPEQPAVQGSLDTVGEVVPPDFGPEPPLAEPLPPEMPPVIIDPRPKVPVALLAAAGLLGLIAWMAVDAISGFESIELPGPNWRAGAVILLAFLLVFVDASVARDSDHEIEDAIEAERSSARKVALIEFLWLLPALVCGGLGVWVVVAVGESTGDKVTAALQWSPVGQWRPLLGLSTAISGLIIGGAIGWAVRIFFTLFFGKEAFGTGDIHIMAAAGCVAGWPMVVMGFWVTVFLALGAWLLLLPMKRTRAIPLVPWLTLGYLIVVVFYERMLRFGPVHNALEVINMLITNISQK